MGLFKSLRQVAANVQELSAAGERLGAEAESARAEWGDGGTARPGWTSAGPGVPVAGPDAVSEDELARLRTLTDAARELLMSGAEGTALVRAVRDSGQRVARHALVDFELTLRCATAPDRGLTVRLPVVGTSLRGYEELVERPVRFDAADPRRLAFAWQGEPRSDLHRGHVKTTRRPDLVGLLPGRALVEGVYAQLVPGEVSSSVDTDLSVQLREPGGLLAKARHCGHVLDWRAATLARRGLDVPVAVEPLSGELEDVAVDALVEELRPRYGELSGAGQVFVEPFREAADSVRGLANLAGSVTSKEFWKAGSAPADGGFAPGDPILEPAGGVTFDQWVAVTADVARDPSLADQLDACAQRHGVPAGAFDEGLRQWQRRQMGHPMMAEKFGRALERRTAELKRG